MAKRCKLDFNDESEPADQPHQEPQAAAQATAVPPAKPAGVTCQRCQVVCDPVPKSRGWVRCPKCGWRHKTFSPLAALKQAMRAGQSRAAR